MARFNKNAGEEQLSEDMGRLALDPLGFAEYAYPWGEAGTALAHETGLDAWQVDLLKDLRRDVRKANFNGRDPVMPMQYARTTGHGVGKSMLTGVLVDWIMSTRPMSKGVITANTNVQLETKTWAELVKWTNLCITSHWWRITSGRGSMRMAHRNNIENWRLDGMAWDATKPEAFAGMHAAQASPFFIFDEASAIPNIIFETAQGGLTDGEPFMFMWSQPTRPGGYFYDAFHKLRHRWNSTRIDSRTAKKTNKKLIAQWIEDYGENSDYVKIRVKGEFPSQAANQFIPTAVVEHAMQRDLVPANPTDPIIIGVDVARFGDDQSTIYVRQGYDARSYPPLRFKGIDTMTLADNVARVAQELLADAVFVDVTGVGGGVVDRLVQMQIPRVSGIGFGDKSPARGYHNRIAWMYQRGLDWMKRGGCMPENDALKEDLIARQFFFDGGNAITLEPKDDMKERLGRSPDDGDGFMLTFSADVGPRDPYTTMQQLAGHTWPGSQQRRDDFDPYNSHR